MGRRTRVHPSDRSARGRSEPAPVATLSPLSTEFTLTRTASGLHRSGSARRRHLTRTVQPLRQGEPAGTPLKWSPGRRQITPDGLLALGPVCRLAGRMASSAWVVGTLAAVARSEVRVRKGWRCRHRQRRDREDGCERLLAPHATTSSIGLCTAFSSKPVLLRAAVTRAHTPETSQSGHVDLGAGVSRDGAQAAGRPARRRQDRALRRGQNRAIPYKWRIHSTARSPSAERKERGSAGGGGARLGRTAP